MWPVPRRRSSLRMSWLIPAALASLAGGVINAWQFLVRVTS